MKRPFNAEDLRNVSGRPAHKCSLSPISSLFVLAEHAVLVRNMNRVRDDFKAAVRSRIAERVGYLCSNPACRVLTIGATEDGTSEIRIGMAAHITAAAPGGPRYDGAMTGEERVSEANGIWLCYDHGKAIDSDPAYFTVKMLRDWKREAEKDAWRRVVANQTLPVSENVSAPRDDVAARFRTAATADLSTFRAMPGWPPTEIQLRLEVEGLGELATPAALAAAVRTLDDLILVAPPGMGKTTTLFQLADALVSRGDAVPLVVPLGDWAAQGLGLIEAILARPAFVNFTTSDFQAPGAGFVLLLDGWNELDAAARQRARVEIQALKAATPSLGLVVSTRKQILDVPFRGRQIELMPLDEAQQEAIASAMRGDAGLRILDTAWRVPGLRDLVPIPLYISALLALPEGQGFPETREEVLRRFVEVHEEDPRRAEALHASAEGLQRHYLEGVAVAATATANTAVSDSDARRAVSKTQLILIEDGQIAHRSKPIDILEALVANHVLSRSADAKGIGFQHQQFQEWFASHAVERQIRAIVTIEGRETLKSDMFDQPAWEEAILFATERMARGPAPDQALVAKAISAAFPVDPMLAAEMIYRASDAVWTLVEADILDKISRWHTPGRPDRAQRFMMNSGRPEFLETLWPLITNGDQQISLKALSNCRRFRCGLLGSGAAERIAKLGDDARRMLLHEIVDGSGIDGLDLALEVIQRDPDEAARIDIAQAFAFRRADRHLLTMLEGASDRVFDALARQTIFDEVPDPKLQARLAKARLRLTTTGEPAYERLYSIVNGPQKEDRSDDVADIVFSMTKEELDGSAGHLLSAAHDRYEQAIAEGVLRRLCARLPLFHGAEDILAAANFRLDERPLLAMALGDVGEDEEHAAAAASVLSEQATGTLLDAVLAGIAETRGTESKFDQPKSDWMRALRNRLEYVPASCLIAAVAEREKDAGIDALKDLASTLARHPADGWRGSRPYDVAGRAAITAWVISWGDRMLASEEAGRSHLAAIANLACRSGDPKILPTIRRLLDENIARYRSLRAKAAAANWQGPAGNEASHPMMHEYQRAFLAIDAPETAAIMEKYLPDEYFGELAARVLLARWTKANEPPSDRKFGVRLDYSRVAERRAMRAADPGATSREAEAIFAVIDRLLDDESSPQASTQAVSLAIVAARLPHGPRDATIKRLISLASERVREALVQSYVLSGATAENDVVAAGVAETLASVVTSPWKLMNDQDYELRDWLALLPFCERPSDAAEVLATLPQDWRHPESLRDYITSLVHLGTTEAEQLLFALAEDDHRYYSHHRWQDAVQAFSTASAAIRLIDLIAEGHIADSFDNGHRLARYIGTLSGDFPAVRAHLYRAVTATAEAPPSDLLLRAIAERPDIAGVLLLVDLEASQGTACGGIHAVEQLVTDRVAQIEWGGSYSIVPVAAPELRRELLAQTSDGGKLDAAARCLRAIDLMRDEYGTPLAEPRHPNLGSGRAWPILREV